MDLRLSLALAALILAAGCSGSGSSAGTPIANDLEFALPWTETETWFFVGGPHCDDVADDCSGRLRYALDFAPVAPMSGNACRPGALEPYWVTAAAPGVVRVAERSLVEIEHADGRRSGYYHVLTASMQVSGGDEVSAGDRLGHPSCEHLRGGEARGPHVHFYFCRKKADSGSCLDDPDSLMPVQGVSLSGWRVTETGENYEGILQRQDDRRDAVDLRCDGSEAASDECGGRRNDLSAR